jgi:hypothetical protein
MPYFGGIFITVEHSINWRCAPPSLSPRPDTVVPNSALHPTGPCICVRLVSPRPSVPQEKASQVPPIWPVFWCLAGLIRACCRPQFCLELTRNGLERPNFLPQSVGIFLLVGRDDSRCGASLTNHRRPDRCSPNNITPRSKIPRSTGLPKAICPPKKSEPGSPNLSRFLVFGRFDKGCDMGHNFALN